MIGIIDADLLGRKKHRFPNLACEKISGYWKSKGKTVKLLNDYSEFEKYERVYVSKVFTDTPVPDHLQRQNNVIMGGTGFFFDKAPDLPFEIEHHMPDYHLYDEWINNEMEKAQREQGDNFSKTAFLRQFKEYTDYSIGFLTRGCFRKCEFCVNKKYDHVFSHSPLEEFYDENRKKICLLDDNFLGFPNWEPLLSTVIETGKPYKFKQGMDERLLTKKKCEIIFNSKYDGDFTFAFDNIADYDLIHRKLEMIREYTSVTRVKFYVLVGFESTDATDIENAFKRIELLMRYKCLPYIMRYQDKNYSPWKESEFRDVYVTLARWGNQPSIFKKMSFRQFCEANQSLRKQGTGYCTAMRALKRIETYSPHIAEKYFDLTFGEAR